MQKSLLGLSLAIGAVASVGCHHAAPDVIPSRQTSVNEDSLRLARTRSDSIARAEAARQAALASERARADSLRRAAVARSGDEAAARNALIEAVYFDFDRAELSDASLTLLNRKAEIIKHNPALRLRIEGNTDDRGSDEYNLALGMRRAAAIKQYLGGRGVEASRFELISNGEERPWCWESSESCWAKNRRAEFVITAGGDRIVAAR